MSLSEFIYFNFKKIARLSGYNLAISKNAKKAEGYESVLPTATYAPWLLDKEFKKTYRLIKEYSFIDKYRCFEFWQLVAESAKLKGALIEVGVWRGGSAALIAKRARMVGIKKTVYFCDTFTGVVKAGKLDSGYKGGEHADTSVKTVKKVIKKLKIKNTQILKGIFPEETGHSVAAEKFRFCHIDVDVYQSAKEALEWLWPRVVIGGIVVFDDYGFYGCNGVTRFVNEERKKDDRLIIHNLNGHAVIIKLKD